jgi:hypothetical protein
VQICTGTDNQIPIRAAIYELASACGEVKLSAGAFGIYDSIYSGVNPLTTANLTISGEGRSTVLESHDKQGGGDYNVIFMDEDGRTVKDLVIEGSMVSSDQPLKNRSNTRVRVLESEKGEIWHAGNTHLSRSSASYARLKWRLPRGRQCPW